MKLINRPGIISAIAVALLAACGSDSDGRSDLVPTRVQELDCPFACAPLKVEVCMENIGAADAASFLVTINEDESASVDQLPAGSQTCVEIAYTSFSQPEPSVTIDSLDEITESDESNNTMTFPRPSGTRCDIICFNRSAPPVRTPVPPFKA